MTVALSGYRIGQAIYTGTRTLVYRGVRESDNQTVVIKFLANPYPTFSELLQFRNQYAIVKNLDIPGIIRPDSLETYGNSYALAMADGGGISLREYYQTHCLELAEVLAIALQLAQILQDLHQNRVIHKDIKPANILIHPETKQVHLIDFSIASLLPKETQEIKNPDGLEGTLAYLAPEQTGRMNRGIDYRADFYALGITLFELLAGQLPFESNDPMELVHCHIAKEPPDLVQFNIPKSLADILAKLMAKNAENRYQSALGFKYDLEICLHQLQETGKIAAFEIGQRDLCDRFTIPEKLYGREAEIAQLLAAFERVADGASELMLVAGFSGIGKTAVVNEVHKPIVRQRGYFIKGKFDQFNRNIPLSAFVQALRDLMGQLLSESDTQLTGWRTQILAAVGENGQVLIEVIPELELIIGKQPIAPELSGSATQNRFNLLFQKFIEVFTTAEHPLVVFLDDLQWADSASLQLIKLLMSDNSYLLMLGAYRDNEVSPIHPFILTLEEIKKANAIVNTITLAPLAFEDTNHLVADTLNCSRELAQPLTELIDRKTQGNPFFTTQFLKALHEDGQITFDRDRRYWECDIAQVNALALTDDVVEFMALQLQKLPLETQQVLKLAACVGNQFDLTTLAIISEQSQTDAATALWKALQEGLVLPTSQIYKFFQSSEQSSTEDIVNPKYRFLHDRVQQAAYSLIPEDRQQSTHLAIARLLRQNTPDAELEVNIFEIVNHWNRAIALLVDPLEKTNLAQLNLIAGNKAKAANAYEPALTYCSTGLALLEDLGGWQNQTSLMLALHEGAAAAAYLSGNFAQMEQWVSAILAQKLEPLDRVKTYDIQIQAHSNQSQFAEAIAIARNALEQFNIHLPNQPTPADIIPAMQEVAALLNGRTADDLLELPVMTDSVSLASMQLLSSITGASYSFSPLLFPLVVLAQVKLSIQVGNTAVSAFGYSCYAILLSGVLEDLNAAYEFGQLALKLASKFKVQTVQAKVNFIVGDFILHCKSHFQNSLPLLTEAFKIGLEVGDFEYTGYSATQLCMFSYAVGKELTTLLAEIEIYIATFLKLNIVTSSNYSSTIFQTIQRLQATRNEAVLTAQKELHHTFTASNDLSGLHYYWVYRLTASYLLNEIVEAKQDVVAARQTLAAGAGGIGIPIFYFYDSLTALVDFSEVTDKTAVLDRVSENQTKLHHHAYHAPMNFQHKYDLVEAERSRVLGNKIEAIEMYDRAISGAKENAFIQEEALANELAAKFYLNWGKEKFAAGYMQEAYYCYAKWGAKAKVEDLEKRYPQLLQPILQQRRLNLNPLETIATISRTSISTSTHTSTSSICDALDFASILKAAQAISSSIELDELMTSLTRILLENSGSKKAALILLQNETWQVRAITSVNYQANSEVGIQTVLESQPLDTCQNVPRPLINYVKNTQKTVIIDRLQTEIPGLIGQYMLAHQPQSAFCTPIVNQGHLVGILYLENQLTGGVFTSDRIQIINLLAAQAAISLENARLYQQSQQALQDLQQAQLQIVQSEKMSTLGNLVAGVAHEINNPVGFISGNINEAIATFDDITKYVDLYHKKFPQPGVEITAKAEELDIEYLISDFPQMLKSIQVGCDRIKGISTSLRTFSRADKDYKVPFNIHDGIDSTILILKHRLKPSETRPAIEIVAEYGDLPPVKCFPGQLNQVFMNILANAIDALDESNIGLNFEEIEANPNRITIQTLVVDNQVKITITDNGMGMSESVKQKIFDHLFTTKGVGKGTGLGLAIARQIVVEKHGGVIEVNSQLGTGTEFVLTLPLTEKK
ncbi:ATP-binding sensor histidine kinase [Tychonema sp. BBK16]|uniref:trifunctional serine/threonine-protein kinase/ATP-binding protein/sensor histidine kinase n=1 Tax=Tychonema sp. BBK16 TaxID=2699888 RepID=UPI001F36B2BF|nr:ATP-binding sensor histidine kinase [Tychonema sp. BBK16]MCF6372759.1 trifunctional serine/threonine-protein kinase/ATP-binding protein/sensor histidine kinase [Tychonema sp. BBK16]